MFGHSTSPSLHNCEYSQEFSCLASSFLSNDIFSSFLLWLPPSNLSASSCRALFLRYLSAATDSMVLLMSGYWSSTVLKWSTESEKRLQYVSARTDATLRAFVSRQISPKYEPSLRLVATSPFAITMSTMPSWMKYILFPIVPSLIIISPVQENHTQ